MTAFEFFCRKRIVAVLLVAVVIFAAGIIFHENRPSCVTSEFCLFCGCHKLEYMVQDSAPRVEFTENDVSRWVCSIFPDHKNHDYDFSVFIPPRLKFFAGPEWQKRGTCTVLKAYELHLAGYEDVAQELLKLQHELLKDKKGGREWWKKNTFLDYDALLLYRRYCRNGR